MGNIIVNVNGKQVAFPEGTSKEEMEAALKTLPADYGKTSEVTLSNESVDAIRKPAFPFSMADNLVNYFTAEGREDVPSYLNVRDKLPNQDLNMLLVNSLPMSNDRFEMSLKEIEPEATFRRDQTGNVIATFPVRKEDGSIDTSKDPVTFYPNPTGLDITDLYQTATTMGTGVVVGLITRGVGLPSTGWKGAGTIGFGEGSLIEGATSYMSGDTPRPINAISSGLLGIAGDTVLRVATGLARMMKNGVTNVIDDTTGSLHPKVTKELESLGIDPNQVSEELQKALNRDVRKNIDPSEAVASRVSQDLPVNVPLTKGQITQNASDLLYEDQIRKGTFGEQSRLAMVGGDADRAKALAQNTRAYQEMIAGDNPMIGINEAGSLAQSRLRDMRIKQFDKAGEAFNKLRETTGVSALLSPNFTANLRAELDAVSRNFTNEIPEVVERSLKDFDDLRLLPDGKSASINFDVKKAFGWRARMTQMSQSGGANGAFAKQMIKTFDDRMLNALSDDVMEGSKDAVNQWQGAIKGWKEAKEMWEGDGILKQLTDAGVRDGEQGVLKVAPEDASKLLFGAMNANWITKPNVTRNVLKLKEVLGEDSVEWNALRQEAILRLFATGQKKGTKLIGPTEELEQFSGGLFKKNWQQMKKTNMALLSSLFSGSEIQTINNFASVAERATTGATNTSNTATSLLGVVSKMLRLGPLTNAAVNTLGPIRSLSSSLRASRANNYVPKRSVPSTLGQELLNVGGTSIRSSLGVGAGAGSDEEVSNLVNSFMGN